jgi:hypothetical protein
MRVEFVSPEGFDHRGDAGAFVTHGLSLKLGSRGDENHSEKLETPHVVSYID